MQRKGNGIRRESQVKDQISVGIDMGGSLWATAVQDWETGKMSYYGLKNQDNQSKEVRAFELVSDLLQSGKRVDVFYEAGRYGYWPARKLIALGANVHILPINKLKVIMSGKTIKTDKLDAKFLAALHPSDHIPTVYLQCRFRQISLLNTEGLMRSYPMDCMIRQLMLYLEMKQQPLFRYIRHSYMNLCGILFYYC